MSDQHDPTRQTPTGEDASTRLQTRRNLIRKGGLAALALAGAGVGLPRLGTARANGSITPVTPTPTATGNGPTLSRAGGFPTVVAAGPRPVLTLPTPTPTPLPPTCYSWRGPLAGWVPNPLTLGGATLTMFDHNGNVLTNVQIRSLGGSFVGLEIGYAVEIVLVPSTKVTLTLVHYNPAGAALAAYEGSTTVGQDQTTSSQDTEQYFAFAGKAVDRVVVKAYQYETLLLDLCFSPA